MHEKELGPAVLNLHWIVLPRRGWGCEPAPVPRTTRRSLPVFSGREFNMRICGPTQPQWLPMTLLPMPTTCCPAPKWCTVNLTALAAAAFIMPKSRYVLHCLFSNQSGFSALSENSRSSFRMATWARLSTFCGDDLKKVGARLARHLLLSADLRVCSEMI